ncbi:hypothetical protein QTP70_028307, partial [Hemibagrus guttatus]
MIGITDTEIGSEARVGEAQIEKEFPPPLPAICRKKGGAVGKKLDDALDLLNEACTYNNLGLGFRTAALSPEEKLRSEASFSTSVFEDNDAADIQEALVTFVLNIFVVTRARDGGLQKQAGIAIEGTEELSGIPDVARACAFLMGLICTLELCYPKKLKYTFE